MQQAAPVLEALHFISDLDRFYQEIVRIERNTRIYDELYCGDKSYEILTEFAPEVFAVMQKALNDEIILSLSKAFDGMGMKNFEYLSQRNLTGRYMDFISPELTALRDRTTNVWKELNIRDYRNTILAHNDRKTLIGESEAPKHSVETAKVLELLIASRSYISGIKINVFGGQQSVSIPVNPNVNYQGYGSQFVNKLENCNKSLQRNANASV